VDNDELRGRYEAGEPLEALAEAAGMARNGVQARLRRIGVPPLRRQPDSGHELSEAQVRHALQDNRSVAAAARALRVGRGALTTRAQHFGLLAGPEIPVDLAERYEAGGSIRVLAHHYQVGTTTIIRWLDAGAIPRRSQGRQPRDG
jgi:hypothetical protein